MGDATEVAAQRKAEAQARHEELRVENTRENLRWRREQLAQRREMAVARAEQRWIQLEYPTVLATRLLTHAQSLSARDKERFTRTLAGMAAQNWFRFFPNLPFLWEPDLTSLVRAGECRPLHGHIPRCVRASANFEAFLDEVSPTHMGMPRAPVMSLRDVMEAVAPGSARYVFTGPRSFLRLLHLHAYVLDKAFVACVLCLSRWLRPENWPAGVFSWPPAVPAGAIPALPELPAEEAALAEAPAVLAVEDGAPAAPCFPAMSSDGTL